MPSRNLGDGLFSEGNAGSCHVLKAYFEAGTGISCNPFNNREGTSDFSHYPGEKTEVQRGSVASPSSHSWYLLELELEHRTV